MTTKRLRIRCEKARAFRKRFPLSRAARINSARRQAGSSARKLAAAAKFTSPRVKFDDADEWSFMVNHVFDMKGIPARSVTDRWVLKQRRAVAMAAAIVTANRIYSTLNNHLKDVRQMSQDFSPTNPTVVVVLDLGWKKSTQAHDAVRQQSKFMDTRGDESKFLWGQKFGQFKVRAQCTVPVMLTWMDTPVDDMDSYWPLSYAAWAGVRDVFRDRESIYAAAVQFLDQIVEANESTSGVCVKLVVAHGRDLDMEALQDVVHCRYEELDAAIKSRVMNLPLSKGTPASEADVDSSVEAWSPVFFG